MKILLLSPHTDDIELSLGATLFKWIEEKNEIFYLVFSDCSDAVPLGKTKNTLENEWNSVIKYLKIKGKINKFPNKHFSDHRQEILDELCAINKEFVPDLVVMPSLKDTHQDHKTIAEEGLRAFKKGNTKIISYECAWNYIPFVPNFYSLLKKEHLERKWDLLKHYQSQFDLKRIYFDKEYIYAWAKFRGMQISESYAEAFEIIKWVI